MKNLRLTHLLSICFILGLLIISSCKKDDPAPLGAQVNAKFLAGEAGKSKSWKMREFTYKVGSAAVQTASFNGCFTDNVYSFTNNAAQDYAASEGTSKCDTADPDAIESGTWAFTLDGLTLNIEVDNSQTPNGLFASAIYYYGDANGNLTDAGNGGIVPYPAFVKKLDDNNMILEFNITQGTSTIVFTLTFTPA
ncbi:MAG: hypothetical protein HOP08_02680 [Cyclobacteriaceae bacterium]|nr:hypothetical protein [Cyclobacteriaceae bacterium]